MKPTNPQILGNWINEMETAKDHSKKVDKIANIVDESAKMCIEKTTDIFTAEVFVR